MQTLRTPFLRGRAEVNREELGRALLTSSGLRTACKEFAAKQDGGFSRRGNGGRRAYLRRVGPFSRRHFIMVFLQVSEVQGTTATERLGMPFATISPASRTTGSSQEFQ
jgi:hypothetical protein